MFHFCEQSLAIRYAHLVAAAESVTGYRLSERLVSYRLLKHPHRAPQGLSGHVCGDSVRVSRCTNRQRPCAGHRLCSAARRWRECAGRESIMTVREHHKIATEVNAKLGKT